jgi:hypothetical protein
VRKPGSFGETLNDRIFKAAAFEVTLAEAFEADFLAGDFFLTELLVVVVMVVLKSVDEYV